MTTPHTAESGSAPSEVLNNCQRWRDGRARYRPAGEPFDPSRAEVRLISDNEAREFIKKNHYASSYPASRMRAGIFIKASPFQRERLGGVAVMSVPMNQAVIPAYFPHLQPIEGAEIGRICLLDDPMLTANAETWTLARVFRLLRQTLPMVRGVVSYSDPVPRQNAHGETVFKGHRGTIYRAFNATYAGRSSARILRLAPNGTVVSDRTLGKIRGEESGIDYALRVLLDLGAPRRLPHESGRDYLTRISPGFFRPLRHAGNHAFTWKI